jgi:PIN domain nuclease of toxin-antitoxin system
MKLLLDTHVLIWSAANPERLSERVTSLLNDTSNSWVMSIASIWEIQIKLQTGKLTINALLPELVESQQQNNDAQILSIDVSHIYALNILPNHHRDPFDRILIAQAMVENIPLLSIDAVFDAYPIQRMW